MPQRGDIYQNDKLVEIERDPLPEIFRAVRSKLKCPLFIASEMSGFKF